MARDTKILQLLLDGQSSLKKEVKEGFQKVNKKIDDTREELTGRVDKIGLQIARLEDDAPTIEEFDGLKKRVATLEHNFASG